MKRSNSISPRTALAVLMALLSFAFILAACAPSGASAQGPYGNAPAAASATPMAPAAGSGEVQVANNAKLGQILVSASGMALYTFDLDQVAVSRCESKSCVAYWPPYVASAQPSGASAITGKLGLITRPDGTMQVTYNEKPLYTFLGDKQPGDVTGDGVNQFGALWHAVVIGGASGSGDNMGNGG